MAVFKDLLSSLGIDLSAGAQVLPPAEAYRLASKGDVVLIDVREKDECESTGLGEGAANVPLQSSNFVDLVLEKAGSQKDAPIILMCKGGMRSDKAYQTLTKEGFTELCQVAGGFMQWDKDGLPVKALA